MNSRERVLTEISQKETDRVPIDMGATLSPGISAIAYTQLKKHLNITADHTDIYDVAQQLAQPPSRRDFLCLAAIGAGGALLGHVRLSVAAPVKDQRAKKLSGLRFGMFICWSFSTFSGYDWTPGVEDINFFNPTGFDPDQWCKTAAGAEMKYILFLTKHHDGFCLWDTKTTDRKVSNTLALKGRDVLEEVKTACNKYGLKLALYFSEGDWSWSGRKDIHRPSIANPDTKKMQLKELLTHYGPIEFIWFDYAVGDGGLSHRETTRFVNGIQPDCFCGYNAGEHSGRLALRELGSPGSIGGEAVLEHSPGKIRNRGEDYAGYQVAEFTYPILAGRDKGGPGGKALRGAQWFYSLPENDEVAVSPEKIYEDCLAAKKYQNLFSLNVGPGRSGRIRPVDVKTLETVGRYIRGEMGSSG